MTRRRFYIYDKDQNELGYVISTGPVEAHEQAIKKEKFQGHGLLTIGTKDTLSPVEKNRRCLDKKRENNQVLIARHVHIEDKPSVEEYIDNVNIVRGIKE